MMHRMKNSGRADNRREAMTINGYWFYFTPPAMLVGDSVLIP
jgi:hypothetical protein